VSIGGRQRGPRDSRFAFVAEHGGTALPVIDAPDFGGVGYIHELAPGARHELSADLRSWATLDAPGVSRVRCAHEVELAPGTASASWPDRGHLPGTHVRGHDRRRPRLTRAPIRGWRSAVAP